MTWTKLDDDFWSHPKVLRVGNEAAGAYVRMLSYCGKHLTDGHVEEEVARFITKPRILEALAEANFISQNGNGWLIPDYLEFNPSREQIREKRARDSARKAA